MALCVARAPLPPSLGVSNYEGEFVVRARAAFGLRCLSRGVTRFTVNKMKRFWRAVFFGLNKSHRIIKTQSGALKSCWFRARSSKLSFIESWWNRNKWGYLYLNARGEILGLFKDKRLRKHLPRMFSLIKNESLGIEDD